MSDWEMETCHSMRRTKPSRICAKCSAEFLMYPMVMGRTQNLSNRRLCLKCSPLRSGIRWLTGVRPTCVQCNRPKTTKGRYCDACRSIRRRWATKLRAVELLGGKCSRCGWNKHPAGLDFHHPNDDKNFTPSKVLHWSWRNAWKELQKCMLLCACCHRIEHCTFQQEGS
jgi:hypothetical protein